MTGRHRKPGPPDGVEPSSVAGGGGVDASPLAAAGAPEAARSAVAEVNAVGPSAVSEGKGVEPPAPTGVDASALAPAGTSEAAPTEPPVLSAPSEPQQPVIRRMNRRATTQPAPGTDPRPAPEPTRHTLTENDARLKAEKPPHY
jgi:hypothetical protein